MGTLTITFSGICTHFHNCIQRSPGGSPIPMRSVLPNAISMYLGMVQRPTGSVPSLAAYYLMPHGVQVSNLKDGTRQFLYGATIEVLNVDRAQPAFEFDWSVPGYHLPDYVPLAVPSPDVVLNHNAACYFDFYFGSGKVVPSDVNPLMLMTQVQLLTTGDGPPQIQITPFPGSPMGPDPLPIIETETLFVANQDYEFDQNLEDKPFDFMLNYLVTQAGLPQLLTKNTPGMPDSLTPLTLDVLGTNMVELGEAIRKLPQSVNSQKEGLPVAGLLAALGIQPSVDLDESCSDSHYP